MEPQTVQRVASLDSGDGPHKRVKKERTMEMEENGGVKKEAPSIKLGLGIGAHDHYSTRNSVMMTEQGRYVVVFTPAQLHELQQQTLIFQCIAARLPVPLHLVIPIWKSVASSFGSSNGGIYKQYPSFIGFSPAGFDYRNMMDPEPGRCRRTDGKKWRCSKNVIPEQKYCERHMHRGRQRSRKLVEASQVAPPNTTTSNNSNIFSESSKTIPTSASCQLMTPFSSNTINSDTASITTKTISGKNDGIGSKNYSTTFTISTTAANPTTATSSIITTPIANAATSTTSTLATRTINMTSKTSNISTTHTTTNNNNSYTKSSHSRDEKAVKQSSKNRSNLNIRGNISLGLDFPPKSVLQVQGCSDRSDIGLEPGRCRRTDGKRWRCSRNVIPEEKYCAQHIHRGAKKHAEASQLANVTSAACLPHKKKIVAEEAKYATSNTDLSISFPGSSHLITNDEKSTDSSGSDTTITDISAYEIGNLSS